MNDRTNTICRQIINLFNSLIMNIGVEAVRLNFKSEYIEYELYDSINSMWISDNVIKSSHVSNKGRYADGMIKLIQLYEALKWSVIREGIINDSKFQCEFSKSYYRLL